MDQTTEPEVHGPIDFLALEFSGGIMDGSVAAALLDLVERDIVRIYDLVVVRKEEDGSITGIDISDLTADSLGGFTAFAGARSGLIGDDDFDDVANLLEPGTVAALLVYENSWAIPFVGAALRAGGQVVAGARLRAEEVMTILDDLEAADAAV